MIECSRRQLSFAEGLIREEVGPLWEEWMRQVDAVLNSTRNCCGSCTRRSRGVGRRVARADGLGPRPRWCCVCCS